MSELPVWMDCAARAGAKPRPAHHVHSDRADLRRQAAEDRGLACGVLSQACGYNVAHNAFVDLLGPQLSALHRFPHSNRAQACGGEVGKRSLKFAHRRAHAGDDHNLVH
jgi:hypothetical protein